MALGTTEPLEMEEILQNCKVISLQLIKINEKKKRNGRNNIFWLKIHSIEHEKYSPPFHLKDFIHSSTLIIIAFTLMLNIFMCVCV